MKTAIIKISGKSINDFIYSDIWITAIKKLYNDFDGVVIVHGAGKTITEWAEKLGHQSEFFEGHRITTGEMMEVVTAVQGGLMNTKLSAKLNSSGIDAVGLSGVDRNTFTAKYLDEKIGFVGIPELTGSTAWIIELLNKNVIPVFSSICCDNFGNLMNVNADLFTEVLSVSLKADTVYFVSDVDGVIINKQVKDFLTKEEIIEGINSSEITAGMIPKLKSCSSLLESGINKIWIGSDFIGLQKNTSSTGTWVIKTGEKINNLKVA